MWVPGLDREEECMKLKRVISLAADAQSPLRYGIYMCIIIAPPSSPLPPFAVEDTTNLPPSPPPSPAAEHFGPLEQGRANVLIRVCS